MFFLSVINNDQLQISTTKKPEGKSEEPLNWPCCTTNLVESIPGNMYGMQGCTSPSVEYTFGSKAWRKDLHFNSSIHSCQIHYNIGYHDAEKYLSRESIDGYLKLFI